MHIGYVTPEYPDTQKPEGGLGTYIQKISRELVRREHLVTVFILSSQAGIRNDEGVELRYVTKVRLHWQLKRNPTFAGWLDLFEQWINAVRVKKEVLKQHHQSSFDVVQVPNYKTPGWALSNNGFFPLVCRCSSYSPLWRAANNVNRQLPDAIADWIEARQVIEADAAFAPSDFVSRVYQRFEAIRPQVIHTPIELPGQEQDDGVYRELVAGKKYLLFFGSLNGVKGVDVLIQAAPRILSRYQDISILFIGRNDPLPSGRRALDSIKSHLLEYWQSGRVVYSPSLPKEQLYPVIRHAFGVILPSRVDNYPNACLESMGLGVPVVGTYDSSLDEIVVDGKTGFLFENGNPEALFHATERLISLDENQRMQMRAEIASEVIRFSEEDRIGQLIRLYQSVIKRSKA